MRPIGIPPWRRLHAVKTERHVRDGARIGNLENVAGAGHIIRERVPGTHGQIACPQDPVERKRKTGEAQLDVLITALDSRQTGRVQECLFDCLEQWIALANAVAEAV